MKTHLAFALTALVLSGTANAAILVQEIAPRQHGTFDNNTVGDYTGFSQAIYNDTVGQIEFVAGADTSGVTIGTSGAAAMPANDSSNYLWGLRNGTTVYFGSINAPVRTTSFLINWGSIDSVLNQGYNNILTLSNGNSLTGDALVALGFGPGDGNQFNPANNRWFRISDDTGFTSFTAVSSQNAFEFDMAVPEPATWAMLIVGFGFIGVAARRRQRMACVAA
jgi:hypothetical protein